MEHRNIAQQKPCDEGAAKPGEAHVAVRLLKQRTVMLTGEISQESAESVIEKLLLLNEEAPGKPIKLFINSPGGDVDGGYAMYDVIRFIEAPVNMIVAGLAASAAVIVLLASPRERRFSLPNARYLIHQPSTGVRGTASDIQIEASEIIKIREKTNKLISDETGRPVEQVVKDTHRNYWMGAKESVEYGLIGKVVTTAKEI